MTFEELQRLFDRVVTAITIVEDHGQTYFVRDPLPFQRQLADLYYKKTIEYLSGSDVNTQAQADVILQSKNIWGQEKQAELDEIKRRQGLLHQELANCEFQSRKRKIITDEISRLEIRNKMLNYKKNAITTSTAEYLATMEKYKYLIFLCTYLGENRCWNQIENFQKADDSLVNLLLTEAFFNKDINEVKVRELARSEPWRSVWISSKKCGKLFNRPMSDVSDLQRVLVGWSIIYDSVYEHPDCPPDETVSNDTLLDNWLKGQGEKRKQRQTEDSASNLISTNSRIQNSSEIGIVVDSPEDVERVYNLNDSSTKRLIQKRQEFVRKQGQVHEGNMPDTSIDLKMRKNQVEMEAVKQRTH